MKRYRLFAVSFDTRSEILETEIREEWEENIRDAWFENKQKIVEGLKQQYGTYEHERKLNDFIAIGREPFSVISFHNKFLRQCRNAFVSGDYYPALTGICALGERVLNHMILTLRDYYKNSPYYKRVYAKKSFDNWNLAIDALEDWGVFVTIKDISTAGVNIVNYGSQVVDLFRALSMLRNESIHFRVDLDTETREPSLRAVSLFQEIVAKQFGMDGPQPWFIPGIKGAHYIKKELETQPFIREFYLPACVYVGPNHKVKFDNGIWHVEDDETYDEKIISDEEFAKLTQ